MQLVIELFTDCIFVCTLSWFSEQTFWLTQVYSDLRLIIMSDFGVRDGPNLSNKKQQKRNWLVRLKEELGGWFYKSNTKMSAIRAGDV